VLPKYRKSLPALHLHFALWQCSGVTSRENKLLMDWFTVFSSCVSLFCFVLDLLSRLFTGVSHCPLVVVYK